MKTLVLVICMVLMASIASAAGTMIKDTSKTPVQAFAPDGTLSATLTVNSTWKSMAGKLYWLINVPTVATCKVRLAPTQAKGAYPQFTVPAATPTGRGVNPATLFVNYSGCTDAEYQVQ